MKIGSLFFASPAPFLRALACLLFLVLGLGEAPAATKAAPAAPPVAAEEVPRAFAGKFQWANEAKIYSVTFLIDQIKAKNGLLYFTGREVYQPGEVRMKISGTIAPKSRKVTFRETESTQTEAETDGAFQGTLSADLQTIQADWKSKSSDRTGHMDLKVRKKQKR